MAKILACDFGGTKLTAGIIDLGGNQWLGKERICTQRGLPGEGELRLMFALAERVLAGRKPAAIGISFGGPVDYDRQLVRRSDHVPGWEGVPLVDIFAERFSAPALMDNDANVAALGEYVYGAGRGCRTLLYVTVSTGVGGGWIMNGEVWRGARSMAGEIGHIVVDPAGPRCLCGKNGCVERFASGPYMAQDAVEELKKHPEAGEILQRTICEYGAGGEAVSRAAADGDSLAQEILLRGARALGLGLGNAANLIDPERIVLGGGVTGSGASWWEMVRQTAQATMLADLQVSIVPAGLADEAPLWGAVVMAQQLMDRKHS